MKKIIQTEKAPLPVGPYSQATTFGQFGFISGQVAINPATNELVNTSIEAETRQVLDNVVSILEEMGAGLDDVLKCSVFVKDMGQYGAINEVYASYFSGDTPPARELVQVSQLPLNVNIEISAFVGLK